MVDTLIRIKAQDDTAEGIGSVDNRLQGLLTQGASIGTGLTTSLGLTVGAVTAVGAGLLALTSSYAAHATQLARTSRQSGLSVRALSELQFAFKEAGLEADDLDDTVFELNLKMGEAKDGAEDTARAFDRVGISYNELGQISASDALLRIADGLSDIETNADRADVAGRIFGDDIARRLLPVLSSRQRSVRGSSRTCERARCCARRCCC